MNGLLVLIPRTSAGGEGQLGRASTETSPLDLLEVAVGT